MEENELRRSVDAGMTMLVKDDNEPDDEEEIDLSDPVTFSTMDDSDHTEDYESNRTLRELKRHYYRFLRVANRYTPAFITWNRVQILIIVVIISLAAFFFTTNTPSDGIFTSDLASTSMASPYIHYINTTHGRPPFIRLFMSAQKTTKHYPFSVKVFVDLEEEMKPNEWRTLDGNIARVVLRRDREQSTTTIYEIRSKQTSLSRLRLVFNTTSPQPVGFLFDEIPLPGIVRYRIVFAVLVLIGVYILIAFDIVHRTIAAMFGAFVALAILSKILERPALEEIATWIDYNTCALLFGMMVMVGITKETGCFEWAAVKLYKISKGNVWALIFSLSGLMAFIAAFLNNITTILLLVPVSLTMCKVLKISPYPVVLTELMVANMGGTATAIGNIPNIMIVNDPFIFDSKQVTFGSFVLHIAPVTIVCIIVTMFYLKYVFKDEIFSKRGFMDVELLPVSEEEADKKADSIRDELEGETPPLQYLEEKYSIHDKSLFISSAIVSCFVIVLFFLNSAGLHLSLAWIAVMGAMVLMLVSGVKEIEEVLEKVDWGTLLFFAALFVLMRTLDEMGLISFIRDTAMAVISPVPEGKAREAVAVLLILWLSAIISAFVDNVLLTAAMVPVVSELADSKLGLPLTPMVWALVFGVCFGGNATNIASSANIIAVGIAESAGYKITFKQFFKIGVPITLMSCTIATIYLLIYIAATGSK